VSTLGYGPRLRACVISRPSTPSFDYWQGRVDGELRLLAGAWRVALALSERMPGTELIDQLLDERSNAATTAGC
jgi:hypothetical protein